MTLYIVTVAIEDKPGALAAVAREVAANGVNLEGFVADPAGLKLVTRDIEAAERALRDAGYHGEVDEIEEVFVDDRPGALADVCERLSGAGINIIMGFGVALGSTGRLYIQASDVKRAAPILDAVGSGPVLIHTKLGRIPLSA